MPSVHQTLHEIRYKIDFTIVDYKQKYYSTNRNPRIIQTKLKDQRLMSLRTCPHDKYLIKPGEFLSLAPKNDQKENEPEETAAPQNNDNSSEVFNKWSMNKQVSKMKISFSPEARRVQSMPETVLAPESKKTGHLQCKFCNSTLDSVLTDNDEKRDEDSQAIDEASQLPDSSFISKSHRVKQKIVNGLAFYRRRRDGRNTSALSPTIEISSAVTESSTRKISESTAKETEDSPKQDDSAINESPRVKLLSFPQALGEPSSAPEEQTGSPLLRRFSFNASGGTRVHSLVSKFSTSSAKSNLSHTECDCNRCERKKNVAWKAVYNEVSLSAARVSTGQNPKTSSDFVNLTSDFIDAKSSEIANDENHVQEEAPYTLAPAKHYAPFSRDLSNIITDSVNGSNPSVLKLGAEKSQTAVAAPSEWSQRPLPASYSRPSTKCEFYSEAGILTMYNYNSDTESQLIGSFRDSRLSTLHF